MNVATKKPTNTIEYVIYVRKSTDDASGERQAQSIPDQIRSCVKFAKENGLTLKMKPDDFEFETEEEIRLEDEEKDIVSRKAYQDTREYYIIKERMSGKFTGRPKWNKLIDKIRNGEIKGLISYSPDRQARNMVDGGNLLDCVDCGIIDLKYPTFYFEPNAAGKMMLGMYFVFSKQYSDKLGEDVNRGKKSSVEKGNSQGEFKYGYYRDENKHFVPDGKNFELMQEAFRMKVEDKASDKYIANRLNANGFSKNKGKRREKGVTGPALSWIWVDSFYCGIYVNGQNRQDLREVVGLDFIPLISEEWHNILVDRNCENRKKPAVKVSIRKDEYAFSLPEGLLKVKDKNGGYSLSAYITKKKHRLDMYQKALKNNPDLKLEDFIQSSWVRYEVKTNGVKSQQKCKTSNNATISINQNEIEDAIAKILSKMKISQKTYESYIDYVEKKSGEITKKTQEKQSVINMRLGSLAKERREYVKKNMGYTRTPEEEEIYQETIQEFDNKERILRTELNNITITERDMVMELDMIEKIIQKAGEIYTNSPKVRKKKIAKLLFPNIFIDNKKRLTIEVNPILSNLLRKDFRNPGSSWNTSNKLWDTLVDKTDFPFIKKMVKFYIEDIEPSFDIEGKLNKTQQMLYGLGLLNTH